MNLFCLLPVHFSTGGINLIDLRRISSLPIPVVVQHRRTPAVHEDRTIGRNVALPLLAGDVPRLAERVPQLALLRGQAVDEEVDGVAGHQRGDDLGGKVGAVVGVVRGVDDEGQGCEEEVDQFRSVGIVDVSFQLGQQVEGEFEFLEDVDEFAF